MRIGVSAFRCFNIVNESRIHCVRPRIPPPLVMLLAAALMWALHRWLPLGHLIVTPWSYFAALPAVIGRAITVAAGARFRQARTTFDPFKPREASVLVTGGVFRVSRNPMYLGLLLLLIAWALWLGTVSPWLVLPLFATVISVGQIVPEERALEERFGETYLAYRRSVRRWIGRYE
jgi:protein-S-isoprenylcysteine O-methyltransferase Ste14